ncbi:S8 family serine peptidase [Hydrotalea sp.]|uniref:S8 family serine peptidase n=1 Tax=Hydrotalea sp. TaxID=2881279 RepID=UPI00258F0432|nr:S8 family serine peptidase [Hydrotalea sp.]
MFKKLHLAIILMLSVGNILAQNIRSPQEYQKLSDAIRISENNNLQRALQLAKQEGWFIKRVTPTGKVIALAGVDEKGNPLYLSTFNNTTAAATTNTNQLWPGGSSNLNLSGSSNGVAGKLAMWDGGTPLTNHVELIGRIVNPDSAALSDHATHVAGTLIATGINPIAKGMAFNAQKLIAYDFSNDQSEMMAASPNLLVSNHSYGFLAGWNYDGTNWSWYGDTTISTSKSYGFGYYDQSAQMFDSIAYNAPYYLISMSAGNSRNSNGPAVGSKYLYNGNSNKSIYRTASIPNNPDYGSIAYTQDAKNILAVGAVNGIPLGYNYPSDVVMSSFSACGPTSDGRIKPDVVADGVNVTSSWSTSTTAYQTESGTSMAAPNATGSLYLVQEYYNKLHPGNFMRSATLKALAIHTANQAGTAPGPGYQFGWGLLNVLKASSVITSSYNQVSDTILEKTLSNAVPYTMNVVASGKGPLVATLSWLDPPIAPLSPSNSVNNTTPRLVNDLDMRISNGNNVYKPWVLNPAIPSAPATKGDNYLDNVEKINVDSAVPGQLYTITITNKGNLQRGTQAFSLIVSGIGGTTYCSSGATNNTGTRIDSIAFAGITNKNTTFNTTYSNFTNITGKIQSNQILPFSIVLNSSDATNNPKVVKVYIDYNSNGSFSDPGEQVATIIASGNGTYTTNIITPGNLPVNNLTIMRIVAVETTDSSTVQPCGNYGYGETQDYRIQFIAPANNLTLAGIVTPTAGACAANNQYLTVQILNKGTVSASNFTLNATVSKGATVIANLSGLYPLTLAAGGTDTYVFQTPFSTIAGTSYTIHATIVYAADQDTTDNTKTVTIAIANAPAAPVGTATICGTNTAYLKASNANSNSTYLWYSSDTATSPIAVGANTSTSTVPSNNTYYLQTGSKVTVGPANKTVYGTGGYNAFAGNYVTFHAYAPLTIETARMYIGNAGNIQITLASNLTVSADGSSYTYSPVQVINFNVAATNPTPPATLPGSDNPADSGAIFNLNLQVPAAGDYALIMQCSNGASIFRNSGISGTIYPMGVNGLFMITGNSVPAASNPQSYYYFFYNVRVSTSDCTSPRTTIVASSVAAPTVTQVGDSLVSSSNNGNQWYFNNNPITGATTRSIKPSQSGGYAVIVTDSSGCQRGSNTFNYVFTAIQNVNPSTIGLQVTPNPANSNFSIRFIMNTLGPVNIALFNEAGQLMMNEQYSNYSGIFNKQYSSASFAPGTYILQIKQKDKVYNQKILVVH